MRKVLFAVVIGALASLAFLAGGWHGGSSRSPDARSERKVLYFMDPMNPGFRSEKAGIAPCGMPLEPVYAEVGDETMGTGRGAAPRSPGAVTINLARQQLIGVDAAAVVPEPMTYPLRLYGKIVPDDTRTYRLNASTDSWVRVLSETTTGSIVSKDQLLAEVLAPAFYNAQVTYLVALDNIDRIQRQLGGQLRHQQTDLADNQIRVAVQALQNLGITDAQVEQLANTRKAQPHLQVRSPANGVVLNKKLTLHEWFKAGEPFYTIADIGKVWVYADVYEDEAMHLRPGMEVHVRHRQLGRTFQAEVSQVLPLFDPVAKTLKVRLDVDNPRYDLRPDMFVDVEIPITLPPSLHVPADAVIDSGIKKVVYVDTGNGVFEPRRVETGWRLGRRIEITSGLMPGEKVVVAGNFLIDSESRMKTAAAGIQGATRKDPVCGMDVQEEKARMAGKIAGYGGETFYFCAVRCKEVFEKEPEKHAPNLAGRGELDAAQAGRSHGWVHLLEATAASREMAGTKHAASISGVVDWDGPDRPADLEPRDWRGWGKFPGAEYLGLKNRAKKRAEQGQEVQATTRTEAVLDDGQGSLAAAPASVPDADRSEIMHDEMRNHPATDDPVRHAK
jgi:membrane fusion protein, copper/silver efflux system